MANLFKLLRDRDFRATAIVGMTKNVGKTVTFNYLVTEFERAGHTLGLVSAGYDGERFDRLTLKDKPRIYAPQGTYAATARACFDAAEAELEMIEESNLSTPLGPVCLAFVKKSGLIELAGPGSVSGLRLLFNKMFALGAEYGLVDGAINRIASASPQVTEGTVLATGASLGPTMDDVIRKTIYRRNLMETPPVGEELLLKAALEGLSRGSAAVLNRTGNEYLVDPVDAAIPLLAGKLAVDRCREESAALVFGGALVDSIINDVMALGLVPPAVIVEDATRIFLTQDIYNRYINQGGKLMVLNKLNLVAVTLNPTDPDGRDYDPKMFLDQMTEALSPCPVFDLIYEAD